MHLSFFVTSLWRVASGQKTTFGTRGSPGNPPNRTIVDALFFSFVCWIIRTLSALVLFILFLSIALLFSCSFYVQPTMSSNEAKEKIHYCCQPSIRHAPVVRHQIESLCQKRWRQGTARLFFSCLYYALHIVLHLLVLLGKEGKGRSEGGIGMRKITNSRNLFFSFSLSWKQEEIQTIQNQLFYIFFYLLVFLCLNRWVVGGKSKEFVLPAWIQVCYPSKFRMVDTDLTIKTRR